MHCVVFIVQYRLEDKTPNVIIIKITVCNTIHAVLNIAYYYT